jgi:NAD(P)H-nitrite reductase large subunit
MHIVIIGNGISGITTARHVRKLSDHRITVISGETEHFWSRTALMYIYMGHMRYQDTKPYEDWFWEKNRIELVFDSVTRLDPATKTVHLTSGAQLTWDKLVLATGSRPNFYNWPGQQLKGVQGMVSKQDLDSLEAMSDRIRRGVIVGGGLIGVELSEMLRSRGKEVTYLVREKGFWGKVIPREESEMVNREIRRHHIDLHLEDELAEVLGDDQGWVRGIRTKSGKEIACEFVGITVGVSPNIDLAAEAGIETGRGFLVNEYLETSQSGIFAIGDCAELRQPASHRKSVEAVWYTGKLMGPVLAQTLCGIPTAYEQGVWFNSAKFYDIEYQVYGQVNPTPMPGEAHLYWEHPDGRKAIRIAYDAATSQVLGFNLMGIRYRQNVCTHWIEQGTPIEEVLVNLGAANFDPEFFPQHEADLLVAYNHQTGKNLRLTRKRSWRNALQVLSLSK